MHGRATNVTPLPPHTQERWFSSLPAGHHTMAATTRYSSSSACLPHRSTDMPSSSYVNTRPLQAISISRDSSGTAGGKLRSQVRGSGGDRTIRYRTVRPMRQSTTVSRSESLSDSDARASVASLIRHRRVSGANHAQSAQRGTTPMGLADNGALRQSSHASRSGCVTARDAPAADLLVR